MSEMMMFKKLIEEITCVWRIHNQTVQLSDK